MNIFILDRNTKKCAEYHCDKHVVKMVLETAQLLCTAIHKVLDEHGPEDYRAEIPYRRTHDNHPCTLWLVESYDNYKWLLRLGYALSREYTRRYGKRHKSTDVFDFLLRNSKTFKNLFPKIGLTEFAQAMPDHCKNEDVVVAYRNYYNIEKISIATWNKLNNTPAWYKPI